MNINPCKDCLYYDNCVEEDLSFDFSHQLKERIYNMFVEGYDCFIKIRRDED